MAKQLNARPLEGKVSVLGGRPTVSLADRAAAVADLSITLTGGSGRGAMPMTFSVGLNVPLAGRAQLIDDATQTVVAESRRAGNTLVWSNVPVIPPGTNRTRVFRITNLRGNASGLGASPPFIPSQIIAFVSVSAPFRVPLSSAQQNVAVIRRS